MKIKTKKICIAFIAALIISTLPMSMFAVSAKSTETDAEITAAYGTPAIDGELDDIWASTAVQDVKLVDTAVIPSETQTTGTVRVMWDEEYLYFFITVDKHGVPISSGGGSENTDDCADVCFTMNGNFTDENNISSGEEEFGGVFRVLEDGTFGGFGTYQENNLDNFKGAMKRTSDTAYNSEYAIPWTSITPSAGYVMGMDIQINDATDDARTGLVNWAYEPCYGWRDSMYHGMVTLLAKPEPVQEPEPEEPPAATEETPAPAPTEAEIVAPVPAAPTTGDTMIIFIALMLSSLLFTATRISKVNKRHS